MADIRRNFGGTECLFPLLSVDQLADLMAKIPVAVNPAFVDTQLLYVWSNRPDGCEWIIEASLARSPKPAGRAEIRKWGSIEQRQDLAKEIMIRSVQEGSDPNALGASAS